MLDVKADALEASFEALEQEDDELEALRAEYEDRIAAMERTARDELKQLHGTIAALRAELEKSHGQ